MNQPEKASDSTGVEQCLPLVVSCGDPNGIGADIILKAWNSRELFGLPPFYVLGHIDQLQRRATLLGMSIAMQAVEPEEATAVFQSALYLSTRFGETPEKFESALLSSYQR